MEDEGVPQTPGRPYSPCCRRERYSSASPSWVVADDMFETAASLPATLLHLPPHSDELGHPQFMQRGAGCCHLWEYSAYIVHTLTVAMARLRPIDIAIIKTTFTHSVRGNAHRRVLASRYQSKSGSGLCGVVVGPHHSMSG